MSSYRAITAENGSLLRRLVDFRICGKSPVGVYLRMNQRASVQYAHMVGFCISWFRHKVTEDKLVTRFFFEIGQRLS